MLEYFSHNLEWDIRPWQQFLVVLFELGFLAMSDLGCHLG
jgi:hypothetical protein